MKRHLALALLGLAVMPLPFVAFLSTSASEATTHGANSAPGAQATIQAAPSMTFTVLNNNDTGAGSLRDAIDQANLNPGPDMIDFLAGIGTINVGSVTGMPLPDITGPVTIDGGSPRVELNGTAAGGSASGLFIIGSSVIVRNLVINRFAGDGIAIVMPSSNCTIQGNFIGTNQTGTSASPNGGRGILLDAGNNLIGGTTLAERNVISGNGSHGIELSSFIASNNTIQGNRIGTDVSGGPLGNSGSGIRTLGSAANNIIGGTVAGAANTIAFNTGAGVNIFGGSNNAILGNSIFSNQILGINLSDDPGVTPNDACDGDSGANNLQNFPSLTSATSGGGITTIMGTLDSTMNSAFRVEFFSNPSCDPSGNGQGQTFIGSANISTPALGCVGTINVNLPVSVPAGSVITATATDPSNNTSEFSQCVTVAAGPTSDLQITASDSPDPVLSGSNITYLITVTNNGPDSDSGATFTNVIPTGTTFVSLSSPGSCSTPPPGGTGTVTCNLGPLSTIGSTSITLVVNVNAAPGSTITNTAMISGMSGDPTLSNNSAVSTTSVFSPSCSLTCPSDIFLGTFPTATSCARVVTFSPTSSGCGAVTCSPPSGSVFAVGSTTVTCTSASEVDCSFTVTIVDETPPSVTCPTGFTVPLPAGRTSTVVNYPPATATDNCSVPTVTCVPPPGSTFPVGPTLVTCTARDSFENINRCFFLVTVLDAEPPVIRCPANVNAALAAGQTSAVVNYPPPTVTDNLPGTSVVCSPASGSSFPAGATTVNCTATDSGGNRASCSFVVGVGGPQIRVTIPGNKTSLEFSQGPSRKSKAKNNPCSLFTVDNIGFAPLIITLDSIVRTGSAVDSGRISDPNDTRFFSVSVVNSDQSLTSLDIGGVVTIQPGGTRNFCAKFAALIPALAGKTTGLAAINVLPDAFTSRIVFRQNGGANILVPISARVSTGVLLVNASNPRAPAEVTFTRSGNDITVSYAVYDSNLDVSRAKYEFLNGGGQVVAGPFEIDLAGPISQANLLKGQSFSVEQRFTGASSNPDATSVRVTVFDGETSVSAPSAASVTSISAADIQLMNPKRHVKLYPPVIKFRPQLP